MSHNLSAPPLINETSAPEVTATTREFDIAADDAGTRLDAFLVTRIPELSRARIQSLIRDADVLVNGRRVKASHRVRAGERIELELDLTPSLAPHDITPEDAPLDIVYEDDAIVVINKPAKLTVHPGAGQPAGTLVNRLVFHFNQLSANATTNARPGIIHRLDADTSGLLVVAKTDAAHEHIAAQFQERTVYKSYLALVHGQVKDHTGRIELPIGRDPRHRTRMSVVPVGGGGRYALSLYKVKQRFARVTLLEVEIKTGRTHQIRVHLAAEEHPVVGDAVYNAGRDNQTSDVNLRTRIKRLDRQFLHAATFAFTHPTTNEKVRFRAPLPLELSDFLDALE